jgi:hypothetical protein
MDQDEFLDLHIDQLDAPGIRKGEDDAPTLFDPYAHVWPDEQIVKDADACKAQGEVAEDRGT